MYCTKLFLFQLHHFLKIFFCLPSFVLISGLRLSPFLNTPVFFVLFSFFFPFYPPSSNSLLLISLSLSLSLLLISLSLSLPLSLSLSLSLSSLSLSLSLSLISLFLSFLCLLSLISLSLSLSLSFLPLESPQRRAILDALGNIFEEKIFEKERDEDGNESKKSGGVQYVTNIESALTRALSVSYMKKMQTTTITPITVPVRDNSSGLPPATVSTPQYAGNKLFSYIDSYAALNSTYLSICSFI
jgi:hypothetical protein